MHGMPTYQIGVKLGSRRWIKERKHRTVTSHHRCVIDHPEYDEEMRLIRMLLLYVCLDKNCCEIQIYRSVSVPVPELSVPSLPSLPCTGTTHPFPSLQTGGGKNLEAKRTYRSSSNAGLGLGLPADPVNPIIGLPFQFWVLSSSKHPDRRSGVERRGSWGTITIGTSPCKFT